MFVKSTNSTNTLLKELLTKDEWPEGERFLRAGLQTAGRGQAGNGWESEEGKNLLCSILIPPRKNLFELNVLTSVAVHRLTAQAVQQRSGLTSNSRRRSDYSTLAPCALYVLHQIVQMDYKLRSYSVSYVLSLSRFTICVSQFALQRYCFIFDCAN